MSKLRSIRLIALPIVVLVVIAAVCVNLAWTHRDTPESRRAARRETGRALRATPPAEVLPALERLLNDTSLHVWFTESKDASASPWRFWTLRAAVLPAVSYDMIGQFTEEQFIRFAGDGAAKAPDAARLKELLGFSERLLARGVLSAPSAMALRERRLDGFFLTGDFDGAIACLEAGGITNRTPAWCKGTAAKLRAHKAIEKKDNAEALKQFRVFGAFMLSDEQKDFEDCDPTTGIVYSREWVAARNLVRCAELSRALKDDAQAKADLAQAFALFATAHDKAKDDAKSLDALRAEMKKAGAPLPALPPKTAAPAATNAASAAPVVAPAK